MIDLDVKKEKIFNDFEGILIFNIQFTITNLYPRLREKDSFDKVELPRLLCFTNDLKYRWFSIECANIFVHFCTYYTGRKEMFELQFQPKSSVRELPQWCFMNDLHRSRH